MCIHICVFCYKKYIKYCSKFDSYICVCFSQAGTFGILQWVMLIDHFDLIALESLKQEVYTQLD